MTWQKKIIIIISVIAIIGIFDFWLWGPRPNPNKKLVNNQQTQGVELPIDELTTKNISLPISGSLAPFKPQSKIGQGDFKPSVLLSVPFVPQAPYGQWDELHNEACEETALVIAKSWLNGEYLTPAKAEEEILQAIDWQEKNWGGHYDLPAAKIAELARDYFQIKKVRLEYGIELEDIKKELSKGNLVLVPTAGRLLENPYFRQPGPYYHMLVVIGYNEKEIITNDPGTKRGRQFKYSNDNFFNAIHDWPGPLGSTKDEVNILAGRKAMIVIEK
jgi:hypothetical protein